MTRRRLHPLGDNGCAQHPQPSGLPMPGRQLCRHFSWAGPARHLKPPVFLVALATLLALCPDAMSASLGQPGLAVPLSADEILRRVMDARGGAKAAARITSFQAKGTADFAWGGRTGFELFAARPNQARTIVELGGSRYEFACDGSKAWETRPGKGPELRTGARLAENQDDAAWFAWSDDLGLYSAKGYEGQTCFQGVPCYALKLITRSGRERTHYYNLTNFLLVGVLERVTLDSGPAWSTTSFLDYRKVAGFRFPTRLRQRTDESEWVIRLNSVRVNGVDGGTFRLPPSPTPPAPCASLSDAEIRTMVQDAVESDRLSPGLVVGLVDAQGSRLFSCGRLDNGASPAVNGDTLFEIGSITKVFTRVLLHDMVERGQMNLDDPVQKYLPASVRMPSYHGRQVTLWDLSTHTSGLPREMGGPQTVERLYAFLAGYQLQRAPGAEFEYSNVGMELLGQVLALKAAQGYEALVRERICRPLGMDSTVITLAPELKARRATGHAPARRAQAFIGLQDLPGAGALFSSGADLLKFASATLGLTPSPLTPLLQKVDAGHNGGTFGFSTALGLDPAAHRAVVVLANCRDDFVDQLQSLILRNRSPRPAQTVPLNPAVCDRYVGQYYSRQGRLRTVRRNGDRLLLQEWGRLGCELFPLSQTNFANALFDSQASFRCDPPTGIARELCLNGWQGERLPGRILEPGGSPLTEAECTPRRDSDLQGVWRATLRAWYWPFFALHFKLRIAEPAPGAFRAEGDSLDQGVTAEPVGIIYHKPRVELMVLPEDGWFEGTLNASHTKVRGRWTQAGRSVSVTLHRVGSLSQTPTGSGR